MQLSSLALSTTLFTSTLLLGSTVPSQANTVYRFTGAIESGSLLGETYTGTVHFDTSSLTGFGPEILPALDLQFQFLGQTYTEADASSSPTGDFFNLGFLGLNFSVDSFEPMFFLSAGFFDVNEAFFGYIPTSGNAGFGSVQYTLVPESSQVFGLLMVGVIGLLLVLK
jgi:hypothetical protein